MAELTVNLNGGLTIGKTTHKQALLRDASAADLIAAQEESEKVIMAPGPDGEALEPALVCSPMLVGLNVLRRQIVSIGEHPGPLSLDELKQLKSATDLALLQEGALKLERATLKSLVDQGRA